jgi:hypothetical protein
MLRRRCWRGSSESSTRCRRLGTLASYTSWKAEQSTSQLQQSRTRHVEEENMSVSKGIINRVSEGSRQNKYGTKNPTHANSKASPKQRQATISYNSIPPQVPAQCWLHSIVFRSTPSCTSSQSGLSSRRKLTRSCTALST